MHVRFRHSMPAWWCGVCTPLLALFWGAGLLLGVGLACQAGDSIFSLMRIAASRRVSIVGLFSSILLPFLLSAAAVYLHGASLLLPVSFLKAFSFGFCAVTVMKAFGSAGWLVCRLLLFSDCCLMPVLFWFWLRHIRGGRRSVKMDMRLCAILIAAVGSIDYFLISPFLMSIIDI